ncbi:hypothetical protein PPSIR1_20589 [Plesiocystis pacifica SIR-1]|uniref:Alpha/beta hydrolase n=2 Tax=Plesiocystis pacifica TaxID=191768 RepID=A6G294_9BACT|nr:hypothetical protein PPSIR1_20589 [Plesiocystis pacifica SIR-1]
MRKLQGEGDQFTVEGHRPVMTMKLPQIARRTLRATLVLTTFSLGACALEDEGIDDAFGEVGGDASDETMFRAPGSFPGIANETQLCTGTIHDGSGAMRYCRNRSIYSNNSNVTRAIILIHGSGSNAKTQYYDPTIAEALSEGVDLTKTDIIAPQFFYPESDDPTDQLIYDDWEASNYMLWENDWRWGGEASTHSRSTFDMVDHIIEELMDHRPNLEDIVVAGQSAGGQFVARYSLVTEVSTPGVDVRYWVANPSTYLWHDPSRPGPTANCSNFDDYPLGLDDLADNYPYMVGKSATTISHNAITRDIYWTVGEFDMGGVTTNCRYTAQGVDRHERWENHRQNINDVCNDLGYGAWFCFWHTARHIEIPGVGHSYVPSLQTDEGREILFD